MFVHHDRGNASNANDVVLNYNIENICLLDSSFIFIIRNMYLQYRLFANSNLSFIYIRIIWKLKIRENKFYVNFIYYFPEEYFIKRAHTRDLIICYINFERFEKAERERERERISIR